MDSQCIFECQTCRRAYCGNCTNAVNFDCFCGQECEDEKMDEDQEDAAPCRSSKELRHGLLVV